MLAQKGFVTIVSGLPRSGTSMMMQMLAAGGMDILTDHIRQPDEDNLRGYYEFELVKQVSHNASWLEDAKGKAVKMVYLLLYDLPTHYEYKIILMSRHIDEVVASQKVMLQRQSHAEGAREATDLAQVFKDDLRTLRAWLERQAHCEVLTINYNFAINQPQAAVDEVCNFLDRSLDKAAMIDVLDPGLYRQRRL